MAIQICIAVVIEKGNKILLIREERDKSYEKSKGLWTLPVGKVDKKESLVDAVLRETREEIGYNIKLNGIVGVYQLFSVDKKDQVLGVAFRAKLMKKKKSRPSEFRNISWINIKDIMKKNMKFRKGIREVIKDYQKGKVLPMTHIKFIGL